MMKPSLQTTPEAPHFSLLPSPLLWDQQQRSELPTQPGVYWYLDSQNQVLYVGKAKDLKKRLLSYRRVSLLLPRTKRMVQESVETRFMLADSEFEALLLEAELIRTYQPKYNVLLKDDKSPLYIAITREAFPRVVSLRKAKAFDTKQIKYFFGPFQSALQVRRVLKLIRRIFPYCSSPQNRGKRPCFYYHLGLCPGACVGAVTQAEYAHRIDHIVKLLQGKKKSLEKELRGQIETFAQEQAFEQAAQVKQQLEALRYTVLHYKLRGAEAPLPQLQQDISQDGLFHLRRLLSQYLRLPNDYSLRRIECYDVSNIQGRQATASLVVLTKGRADTSQYRQFRIKTLNRPNDVGMLTEVLRRRQRHSEWEIPGLLVVDGGKTQVKAARKVIQWDIPVVGLAKRPDRLVIPKENPTAVFTQDYAIIRLDPESPATKLLQVIRDEAHRFAKKYHQHLHRRHITLD